MAASFLSSSPNLVGGGYVVLDTRYMRSSAQLAYPSVFINTENALNSYLPIFPILRSIISGQAAALSQFVNYLHSMGIINVEPTAQGIKELSTLIRQALNNGDALREAAAKQQDGQMAKIQETIDNSIRQESFNRKFEEAMVQEIGNSINDDTVVITQEMLRTAFERTREKIVFNFMPQISQYIENTFSTQEIYDQLETYLPVGLFFDEQGFNSFVSGKLDKNMLARKNGLKQAIKKSLGSSVKSVYKAWRIQESLQAFFMNGFGSNNSRQVGQEKNRATTSTKIVTEKIEGFPEIIKRVSTSKTFVQNKDDAFATFQSKMANIDKEITLRVHISSKYRHLFAGGKAGLGAIADRVRDIELESSGSIGPKYYLIEQVFKDSKFSGNISSLRFAINNLASSSLYSSSGNKANLERQLASLFSAYMFNATFEDMTAQDLVGENASYNNTDIYLFDVNGYYFTLGEICEQYLLKLSSAEISEFVKVSITPDTSQLISQHGGRVTIIKKPHNGFEGYSQKDWDDVRDLIESRTKMDIFSFNFYNFLSDLNI